MRPCYCAQSSNAVLLSCLSVWFPGCLWLPLSAAGAPCAARPALSGSAAAMLHGGRHMCARCNFLLMLARVVRLQGAMRETWEEARAAVTVQAPYAHWGSYTQCAQDVHTMSLCRRFDPNLNSISCSMPSLRHPPHWPSLYPVPGPTGRALHARAGPRVAGDEPVCALRHPLGPAGGWWRLTTEAPSFTLKPAWPACATLPSLLSILRTPLWPGAHTCTLLLCRPSPACASRCACLWTTWRRAAPSGCTTA